MTFRHSHAKYKASRKRRATSVRVTDKVTMKGGLNLVDSADQIRAGELLISKNYEPHFITGAYSRIAGYEVFDGQPQPSKAEYWLVTLTGIADGPFQIGEVVGVAGETAIVADYVVDEEASDDSGFIIITDLSNAVDDDQVWTGATSLATGEGPDGAEFQGQADEDLHDAAQLAAEETRRVKITKVGDALADGPTRGVHVYKDTVYAFRDNVGDTEGTMWKSTPTGWEAVPLGFKVRFEEGSRLPVDGETIIGLSSGASCVVERSVLKVGMWAGEDGEGYIVTTLITGTFTVGEEMQIAGETVMEFVSSEAQTLPKGGSYNFRNYNFKGNILSYRMYGANGVGNAFEFDGRVFVLIESGMVVDAPTLIGVHRGQLLLAFEGGSLQHSGKNQPLSFRPVTGANEILAGDEITGFIEEVGDVSFVFTRNKTFRLEGFVQENIQLKLHNSETGAIPKTVQRIGKSVYLDDRGFATLPTTDAFGDFASNQISVKIDPLLQAFLKDSEVLGSVIHRGKSLYRCFFSNGEAVVMGFSGNKVNAIVTIDYGLDITATSNGEIEIEGTNNGQERVFLGTKDGWVYETDIGRNFNGEAIQAYFVTAYHFSGAPEMSKRYRRATIYMDGKGRSSIRVYADYNYNEEPLNFETIINDAIPLGGGRYGISRHGSFVYSAASKADIRVPMNSHARNVSLIFFHEEANEEPHTIYAVHYHLSLRKIIRS